MTIESIQSLIGKQVTINGITGEVGGVHLYISKKGVKSIRIHLVGIKGYININI